MLQVQRLQGQVGVQLPGYKLGLGTLFELNSSPFDLSIISKYLGIMTQQM